MPPKKKAAAVKKPTAVSKGAIAKVVKKQGKIAAKAPAAPGNRSGTRSSARAGAAGASGGAGAGAKAGGKVAKSPAPKAPAAKAPPKRTVSTGVTVAAGQAKNLVADTDIYVEGKTVWACDLSLIDRAVNSDKFYNMRVLQAQDGSAYWCTQQWGRTGTSGQSNIDGPFPTVDHAKAVFDDTFNRKTGCKWGASFSQKKGKYNFVKKDYGLVRNASVSWEYELKNDPLKKPDGWYPYDGDVTTAGSAMANMEEYWEQYQANSWLDTRFVESGQWTYKVDFNAMAQTNTTSNKTRPIRRV
mmetsp:Transcript_58986/g.120818  ORF Transcript_58986/g.120818 Transcript_58986/m.120818 type:complete len:299 (+) Transcript_58986:82-978(+)